MRKILTIFDLIIVIVIDICYFIAIINKTKYRMFIQLRNQMLNKINKFK